MMKYFTTEIDKYLANWLQVDTWYTDQDIEDRFYPFVMAIDRYSPLVKDPTRSVEDPDLQEYTVQQRLRIVKKRTCRNPRTRDKAAFVKKVLLAIHRNWPDFDQERATQLIERLATEAMTVFDALWYDRQANRQYIRRKDMTDFR